MKSYVEICKSDLSGADGAETVTVPAFEIDLTQKEAEALFAFLAKYTSNGRKVTDNRGPRVAQASSAKPSPTRVDKEQNKAMREWLVANGYAPSERGRIKRELQDAYQSRTPAVEPAWTPGTALPAEPVVEQAVADAELDSAEKTQGAHTRKAPVKAAVKAQEPPAVPPATFSNPPASNVREIKTGRTGARAQAAGKVTAAATKAAGRTTAKVAGTA